MNARFAQHLLIASLVLTGIAATAPAFAATQSFSATLNAQSSVPPNDSKGTGLLTASYNTTKHLLKWRITYKGLSGAPIAAHFHGPAAAGANAGPVVPLKGALKSPITGSESITDAQAKELADGMWYINIHTAAQPDGEIRGQVELKKMKAGKMGKMPRM